MCVRFGLLICLRFLTTATVAAVKGTLLCYTCRNVYEAGAWLDATINNISSIGPA